VASVLLYTWVALDVATENFLTENFLCALCEHLAHLGVVFYAQQWVS